MIYIVNDNEAGLRLDEFVHKQEMSLPLAAVRRAIEGKSVKVNNHFRSSGWRLRVGDSVAVELAAHLHCALIPAPIALDIIYEDKYIVAINKPPFMLSHPSKHERTGTLINALLYYLQQSEQREIWPALVHRLDRDTSGVILVAKQERALQKLFHQFNDRQVKKVYQAIVWGTPLADRGIINAPIGWHPGLWPRWRVMAEGKAASTHYQIAESYGQFSLLELEPQTGRTHQLRIHLAHIGHPILHDHTYGRAQNKQWSNDSPYKTRHFLHAASLTCVHPITHEVLVLRAPLSPDMAAFLKTAVPQSL